MLLQKDYKIQIPVIEELLKDKYDPLMGIKCSDFKKESNQRWLEEINDFISGYYDMVRKSVKTQKIKEECRQARPGTEEHDGFQLDISTNENHRYGILANWL